MYVLVHTSFAPGANVALGQLTVTGVGGAEGRSFGFMTESLTAMSERVVVPVLVTVYWYWIWSPAAAKLG